MKDLIFKDNEMNEIYSCFRDGDIIFFYHGAVTHEVIEAMSNAFMKKMKADNIGGKLLMSLFGVFIEMAQNIARYSAERQPVADESLSYGIIRIVRNSDCCYSVEGGNKVYESDKLFLEKYLGDIKRLDETELKKRYRSKLMEQTDVLENNAGLGILEMALKSKNCFSYNFQKTDSDMYFFTLRITVKG